MNKLVRNLRNQDLICQDRINRYPMVIVGVGAIGSIFAQQAAKMGILNFVLVDPDVVSEENLGVQGFYEKDLGVLKVDAVSEHIRMINSDADVQTIPERWTPEVYLPSPAVIACPVDSIEVRRDLFEYEIGKRKQPFLIDGRMTAETLRVLAVDRSNRDTVMDYKESLFAASESFPLRCTARSTIYCASICAGFMIALYKQWIMREPGSMWHSDMRLGISSLDLFDIVPRF